MNTEKQILDEKLKIDLRTKELNNQNLSHERNQNQKLNLAKLAESGKIEKLTNQFQILDQDLAIARQKIAQEKEAVVREFSILKDDKQASQATRHVAENLQLESELTTENVLKKKLIETHREIIKNNYIDKLKVVNIGSGNLQTESAGAVLGQILATSNAIQDSQTT